jgi:regulator of nucleoside diphosphate kinase
MNERTLFVTEFDIDRLRALLEGTRLWSTKDREYLQHLEEELDRAQVVPSKDVPGDVITMNSRVTVKDLDSGRDLTVTIVFPPDADLDQGKISILAPIGTALLGYRVGDTVEWRVPAGVRRLRVEQILYQPEAAGHYHL